jgi:hypothetical protein
VQKPEEELDLDAHRLRRGNPLTHRGADQEAHMRPEQVESAFVLSGAGHEVAVVTGAGAADTGAELAVETGTDEPPLEVLEGEATTRLTTTVFTTRLGGLLWAAAVRAFGPSAGSAPWAICQEIPAHSPSVTTVASAATLATTLRVGGRRIRVRPGCALLATLDLTTFIAATASARATRRGPGADRRWARR